MKKRHLSFSLKGLLFATLWTISVGLFAQNITVKGSVVNTKNEPIIGASVKIKGTANGKLTDANGQFTLENISSKSVLEVKFIGMQSQLVQVNGKSTIVIVLKDDNKMLDELVVTALGVMKQARSVGYSTTKVSTDEMLRANAINPVNALQGKVAGINIQSIGSSGVTSSSSITIRGAKSIDKNNSPIWVIDGMVMQESIKDQLSGTDWGSQLKNLNPDDYESVTVLKGAAATALYGSRGANGAIVIVSKSGKKGKQGLGIEISQTLETAQIYDSHIQLQNIYGAGSPFNLFEGGFLADGSVQKTAASFGPKMEGQMVDQYLLKGEKTPFSPHPNNWKTFYQQPLYSNTNVAISGGSEKTSFRLSYSHTDNNGVFKYNEFKRDAISFKFLADLNKIFSVDAGVSYSFSKSQNGASQGGWQWGTNMTLLSTYYMPRNFDLALYENNYRDPETKALETSSPFGSIRSYLHTRDMNKQNRDEQSLLANLTLRAKIAPWLDASIRGNYNFYGIQQSIKEYGTGAGYSGGGKYGRSAESYGNYNLLGMIHSGTSFLNDDLTFDAILSSEVYGNTQSFKWKKETNGGLVTPAFFAFSNSKNKIEPEVNYTPANQMTIGVAGIINLGWREQLFLELTGRNDWMSTLAYPTYMKGVSNNITVFYPSVNLSWLASETFELPQWVSLAKLRASLAQVGMGTSAYKTTDGYGVFNQSSIYDPDRNSVLSANPNLGTLQNKSLKPEIQQSLELGFDIRLFKERFNIDFAYYKTNTFNQIMSLPSVVESGAERMLINAGNIQNQGIEIQVDATPYQNKDFRWTVGGNFTLNRGKIIKLHNDSKEQQLMWAYDAGPEIWAFEGGAFGVLTSQYGGGYSALARFNNSSDANDPRNGMPLIKYSEYKGLNIYEYLTEPGRYGKAKDDKELEKMKERKILGKVEADFLTSFNTSLSYKRFNLYAQIDARVGGQFFSHSYKYASSTGNLLSSLNGRDAEHGGLPRTNYKGEIVNNGIMFDAVFDEGTTAPSKKDPTKKIDVSGKTYREAVEAGLIDPMLAGAYYGYNFGWGMPLDLGIMDNTWVSLREITLSYLLPENWAKAAKLQQVRASLSMRNVCYLYNGLKDNLNPESISSNNPLTPFDIGGVPYSRNFSLSLSVKF